MDLVWCYLVRSAAGAGLRGLRLIDRRGSEEWSVPARANDELGESQAEAIGAAARWLAERLAERRSDWALHIALDAEGSRCAWLSAPSGEQSVVLAAVNSAALGSGDDDHAGPGVWDPRYGQPQLDLSVQSLSATATATQTRATPTRRGPRSEDRRERLAVLTVPDLSARLLLDELDRLGIEVASVTSLWHAIAAAWDPGAASENGRARGADRPGEVVVAESAAVSAEVLIDPLGRLVWSWSRAGRLIAAGSQRLRRTTTEAPASAAQPEALGETARRLTARDEPPLAIVEVNRMDLGRLINDWLAWSLQLGAAPARVVCLAPTSTTCGELASDLPETAAAAAVVRTLAERWPGAATLAQVDDDPVRTTLMLLADREVPNSADDDRPDPRLIMLSLSSRPRRMTRRMYRWLAAALAAGGVSLGVLAWKIERGAAAIEAQIAALAAERNADLVKVRDAVPNVERDLDPARLIRTKLVEAEKNRAIIVPEPPIWALLDRILAAVSTVEGARLKDRIRIGSGPGAASGITVSLLSVNDATAVQAAIREKTSELPVEVEAGMSGPDLRVTIRWKEPPRPAAAGTPAAGGSGGGAP